MGRRFAYSAGCVLLAAAVVCGLLEHDRVRVQDDTGRTVLDAPLPDGTEFGIRFIHSVARSPVEEWFSAEGGHIRLNRTVYQDFGAGLPHEAAAGQQMVFGDGRIELSGFTLSLPQLDVRVGRVAQHHVLLPEDGGYHSIALDALAPMGAVLIFSVYSQSLAATLWLQMTRAFRDR